MEDMKGRGRLSSIDMLPPEAEGDVVWALEQLRENKRLQIDILAEFNARLADRGIGPVSKSAFGRFSVRKAVQYRKLDEVRRISAELAKSLGTSSSDEVTIAVAEMVKVMSFQLLEEGKLDSKGVMELARATHAVVSAQKISGDYRAKVEEKAEAKARADASRAVEKIAQEAGLSKDRIAQLRREFLGVRPRPKPEPTATVDGQ